MATLTRTMASRGFTSRLDAKGRQAAYRTRHIRGSPGTMTP
jgi:hypothetical protein